MCSSPFMSLSLLPPNGWCCKSATCPWGGEKNASPQTHISCTEYRQTGHVQLREIPAHWAANMSAIVNFRQQHFNLHYYGRLCILLTHYKIFTLFIQIYNIYIIIYNIIYFRVFFSVLFNRGLCDFLFSWGKRLGGPLLTSCHTKGAYTFGAT